MKQAQEHKPTFDELFSDLEGDLVYESYTHPKDTGFRNSIFAIMFALFPIVNFFGLWLAVKSFHQSRFEGYKGTLGVLAILINAITVTIVILAPFFIIYLLATAPYDVCAEQGSGRWLYNGETIDCNQ